MDIDNLLPAATRRELREWLEINHPDLFNSRLEKFLKNTRENRMYGEWHDGGRLLEK